MANVSTAIKNWSVTAASNQPDSIDAFSLTGDLQSIQSGVRNLYAQDTIASATTCDIGSKDAGSLTITGTTTITGFGTVSAGIRKIVTFSGALTLTYNATSLLLPTNANITTVAGDTAEFESLGSGNWRCNWYERDDGSALYDYKSAIQSQSLTRFTAGGTADAITGTLSPAITSYTAGLRVTCTPPGANTVTNPTLNLNSLGTKTIKKRNSSGSAVALAAGDYNASGPFDLEYDGTDFILLSTVLGKVYLGYWPAAAIKPRASNGCAGLAWDESTTNKVMTGYLAFDAAAVEYASFSFKAPTGLDESAGFTAKFEWVEAASATSHDCVWSVEIQAQGDGDTIDSAFGTAVTVTDTGSSGTRRVTSETSTITPGGTWTAGDEIIVRVSRLATSGSDTLDVDAKLIGVTLLATQDSLLEA